MKNDKATLPGKILDLLWTDDSFVRDVMSIKKLTTARFPRYNQWCDDNGLNMSFALAGFDSSSIKIEVKNDVLSLSSKDNLNDKDHSSAIEKGFICRGIAKRNFEVKFVVNKNYEPKESKAHMKNGLLTKKSTVVNSYSLLKISVVHGIIIR